MLKSDPLINKEHGSWAILFVPPLTGILATKEFSFTTLLFLITALAAFLTARPAEIYFQDVLKKNPPSSKRDNALMWMLIYISVASVSGALLLLITSAELIIAFGLCAFALMGFSQWLQFNFGKTLMRDISGIAGLTAGAPAIYYLHTGLVNGLGLSLWLFNFLFFISGAFYVHAVIERVGQQSKETKTIGMKTFLNLFYHISLAAALILYIRNDYQFMLALAFLPMIVHAITGVFLLKGKANFKKIGFTLLGYSVFFGLMIGLMR